MKNKNTNIQIEKLRALAVLLVLLFHAGAPHFEKGYLGVDIFFIISGYLMTSHIFESLERGNFVFSEYCEKRIRRIMPAFLVVALATIPPALIILMPDHLENYGQSLVASTLFTNNILLYITSNYWDARSELKPLLHTWSLGIEIQFYLIYPIIIFIAFRKFLSNKKVILYIFFSISLLPMIVWRLFSAEAIFYLLPFRFFEFVLGGLIAVNSNYKEKFPNLIKYLGFILILVAIFKNDLLIYERYDSSCRLILIFIGCFFVINSKPAESSKLKWLGDMCTSLGAISYSIYLFHQPIFAFIRASSQANVPYITLLATTPVIILLSSLTFKYIEGPFRSKSVVSTKNFLIIITSSSLFLIMFGLCLHLTKGLPNRFQFGNNVDSFQNSIFYNERVRAYTNFGPDQQNKHKIMLVGDSFARDFANVMTDGAGIEPSEIMYSNINLDKCENVPILFNLILLHNVDFVYISYQKFKYKCNEIIENWSKKINFDKIIIIGPKSFGGNVNFLSLIPKEKWVFQKVEIDRDVLNYDAALKNKVVNFKYISLVDLMKTEGKYTKITDNNGDLISIDGEHLTKPGAIYVACLLEKGGYSSSIHNNFRSEARSCVQ